MRLRSTNTNLATNPQLHRNNCPSHNRNGKADLGWLRGRERLAQMNAAHPVQSRPEAGVTGSGPHNPTISSSLPHADLLGESKIRSQAAARATILLTSWVPPILTRAWFGRFSCRAYGPDVRGIHAPSAFIANPNGTYAPTARSGGLSLSQRVIARHQFLPT